MAKALDCDNVIIYFKLQSSLYIHFLTNTFLKGMNILIPFQLWIKSSSSSSCRAASTDIPDPLSPLLPIVHRLWQGYIPYPHIAVVCMFELVVLLLPGHMWGSIRVHHLWAHPCFSSSVLQCLVRLTWMVFVMGGR